ncbi:MAG: DUF1385 domain-containing protein [Myxococcota bacterium]|nr:DUF1385 domain-containing protein [Myxococcota bacterium]
MSSSVAPSSVASPSTARPYIGGQAVIEGVMMRAPGGVAVAVRRPDGHLVVKDGPLPAALRNPIWKWPGVRGIGMLYESLSLGYGALQFSADQQMQALEASEAAKAVKPGIPPALLPILMFPVLLATTVPEDAPSERPASDGTAVDATTPKSGSARGAMLLSTALALGLFIALPQLLATGAGWALGVELDLGDWRFHALTGGFKLLVLTSYLFAISRIDEVRRVFQYHGAEHKTIFAYEAQLPMSVENVRAQSTLHPRCGTTFLITVVIVSVILGSIATPLLLPGASGLSGQIGTLALRIALLPAIAAISYELQRLSARYCTTGPLRVLLWPGFLFQKITTRQPDDTQVEIAIASMQSAFWRQREGDRAPEGDQIRTFPSLEGALAHYGDGAPARAA